MSSSASSRPMAARRLRRCSRAWRLSRGGASPMRVANSRRWISTPSWRAGRRWSSSTSWRTAMRRAPGIRSAIWMSRNCSAAGIDVYTTVNIQHLESLNDIVAQITRVRVRETVPDRIVDRGREVEVIDLTPDDLIQRLREGKVYVPDQAERALKHYFSPGNLTALRELALRRAAERVDEQMLRLHARACHRRPLGGRRAPAGLRQRAAERAAARALCQARRGSPARPLDGALCRDSAPSAAERGGT